MYNDTSAKGEFWFASYLKNVKTGFFKMYSMYIQVMYMYVLHV